MKTKLKAEFVKRNAIEFLNSRNKRIQAEYENAISKVMRPSVWNLWRGRSRDKAISHIDKWGTDSLYKDFMSMLNWKGGYYANIVEDALKMSNLAISNGQEFVWISDEELFFIKD